MKDAEAKGGDAGEDRDGRLVDLAASVSDGGEIDWDTEAEGGSSEAGAIHQLRLVDRIARLHRSPAGSGTTAAGLPDAGGSWGGLEIVERIGEGAFGTIFRARDHGLKRDVALKLFPASGHRPRFQEARLLARVRHPNVVTVHGVATHGSFVGIWTELVEGRTLEELLAAGGPLGAEEAGAIGVTLCSALAAVHAAGVVHRDVKAANVMRETGGRIVLMDFGAGAAADSTGGSRRLSGTPLYMAPEVLAGGAASPRSDIYSLGVLLWHVLTGSFPVEAADRESLEQAHRERSRRTLRDARPGLPDPLVKVVEKAIDPVADRRHASAGDLQNELLKAIAPRGGVARRSGRLVAALSAVVAVGVALAAMLLATRGPGAGGPYSVEAALYRGHDGVTGRILSGAVVAPGDSLYLEIEASRPLWIYVLNRDEKGRAFMLFPLPGGDLGNPLPAGTRHRLPGTRDGRAERWQVTSAGGREEFLIVASPERLADLEERAGALEAARRGRPVVGEIPPGDPTLVLRGIGGVVDDRGPGDGGGPRSAFDAAIQLAEGREHSDGVWVRRIELANP